MDPDTNARAKTPANEAPRDKIEDAVNAWFSQYVHNSPVSQSTEAINHLRSVLPHLVAALKEV